MDSDFTTITRNNDTLIGHKAGCRDIYRHTPVDRDTEIDFDPSSVTSCTTCHDPKEVTMQFPTRPMATTAEFPADTRGILPAGTVTTRGTIVDRSYTAYEMADGSWVPFDAIHERSVATPLVALAGAVT